jgi:arginase
MSELLVVPFHSGFGSPARAAGPDALASAIGGERRVLELADGVPVEQVLADGFPRIKAAVAQQEEPLAVLGECTLTPAFLAAVRERHPDVALVWIDAHGDLNTPQTSPSGFLGGMPFAVLLGWCHPEQRAAATLDPPLPENRAALVGARDLDPGEQAAVDGSDLVVSDDVTGALEGLPEDVPLWVHVDSDVLDPTVFPGCDFPAPGGWSAGQLREELQLLADSGRVVALSICAGNPAKDASLDGFRALAGALGPLLDR